MGGATDGGVKGPGAGLAGQPVKGVESLPLALFPSIADLGPVEEGHGHEEELVPLVLALLLARLLLPDGGLVIVPGQGGQEGGQGGLEGGHPGGGAGHGGGGAVVGGQVRTQLIQVLLKVVSLTCR